MLHFALIGHPVSHSYSATYHNKSFAKMHIDADYSLIDLTDITHFAKLVDEGYYNGFNVTIPYKRTIIPFLDALSPEASAVGAVNVVAILGKRLIGHNTDITGFRETLRPLLRPYHNKALILGTGGASLAVRYVLNSLGIPYTLVSRTEFNPSDDGTVRISYKRLTPEIIHNYHLIINTTPLGMHPNVDTAPVLPYESLTPDHLLYDLVYNPADTLFLRLGKQHGSATCNGLNMLHTQADASLRIWLNTQNL